VTDVDPQRVQSALVCMYLDPAYAEAVRGAGPLPELRPPERALLRDVDPRALRTDAFRRARAVHTIVEEYPVSAALLGVAGVDAFFSTPAFRTCVFAHGSMALSFGTWLGDRAAGPGHLEAAAARARRPAPHAAAGLACSPRIVPLRVPAGTLEFHERLRARLGADPVAALAHTPGPARERPPRSSRREAVLVEASASGEVSLGTASEPLVRLLIHAATPRPRAELVAEAVRLGADDAAEAASLIAAWLADGLLVELG
jgi:hypothetical protein